MAVLVWFFGADEWILTTDLRITNALLCQLSYTGTTGPRMPERSPELRIGATPVARQLILSGICPWVPVL